MTWPGRLAGLYGAKLVAEWVELTGENTGATCTSLGGRGNKGGVREAERQLGLEHTEVRRAELSVQERAKLVAEWVELTGDKPGQLAQVLGGRGNEGGVRKAARELGLDKDEVHRAELSVQERAKLVAEWVELTGEQVGQLGPPDKQYQQRGVRLAARELPVEGKTEEARRHNVRRAIKIASLSTEAQAVARTTPWRGNNPMEGVKVTSGRPDDGACPGAGRRTEWP